MGTTGSAGAIYCCSQDERKNNFKGYINNLQMTGIDGLFDLEDVDCSPHYKNEFESRLMMTKDGLLKFYEELMTNNKHSRTYSKGNLH